MWFGEFEQRSDREVVMRRCISLEWNGIYAVVSFSDRASRHGTGNCQSAAVRGFRAYLSIRACIHVLWTWILAIRTNVIIGRFGCSAWSAFVTLMNREEGRKRR